MARRGVFEAVGGFSTDYFMYAEDVDLCYKIRKAGWLLFYVGTVSVVHYGKQSAGRRDENEFAVLVMRESIFQLLRKTRGVHYAWLYRSSMSFAALFRVAATGAVLMVSRDQDLRRSLRGSLRKWWKIFRWGIGLEMWTLKLRTSAKNGPSTASADSRIF